MNKQPWYHRVEGAILFTTSQPITEAEFISALEKALKPFGCIKGGVEIECINIGGSLQSGYGEPEPGDPADL